MKILNITYVPDTNTLQAVISFEHKEKTEHTIVFFDLEKSEITTDFLKIADSKEFETSCLEAMNRKIDSIENPGPIL